MRSGAGAWGGSLLGNQGKIGESWGGDPFGELGSGGASRAAGWNLGSPSLANAMRLPKRASEEDPDGAHDPSWEGLLRHSRHHGPLRGVGSAAGTGLRTPPSNAGSFRTYRGAGRGQGPAGARESGRPHPVPLASLTSPAHQARSSGHRHYWKGRGCRSRSPRRCHPRSPRSCSSGARQRRPRCHCHCRPHWMSSRTWGRSGGGG